MDDSGAILCQISTFKDMLDQVNQEIESNIQITREIESETVRCAEIEISFSAREAELMKLLYASNFELRGLLTVATELSNSVKLLEEEVHRVRSNQEEILKRMNDKREGFTSMCLEFQRGISQGRNDELLSLLSEEEILEDEIYSSSRKNVAAINSSSAFVEDIIPDLHDCNHGS